MHVNDSLPFAEEDLVLLLLLVPLLRSGGNAFFFHRANPLSLGHERKKKVRRLLDLRVTPLGLRRYMDGSGVLVGSD